MTRDGERIAALEAALCQILHSAVSLAEAQEVAQRALMRDVTLRRVHGG